MSHSGENMLRFIKVERLEEDYRGCEGGEIVSWFSDQEWGVQQVLHVHYFLSW